MSDPIRQERDRLPGRRLGALGVGWLLLATLGVLWAVALWNARREALGGPLPSGTEVAPVQIGVVDQTGIRTFHRAARHRAEAGARARSWGWVDRERGVVHLPVDDAARILLGEPP